VASETSPERIIIIELDRQRHQTTDLRDATRVGDCRFGALVRDDTATTSRFAAFNSLNLTKDDFI
jgi:hypothetical protein